MSEMPSPIYLDHAATTPVASVVIEAMRPYFDQTYGNSSSLHTFGRDAAAALDEAHMQVGCAIGARAGEIVFTGSGTESDNLAIRGSVYAARKKHAKAHVISALTEHHAVEVTLHQLQDLHDVEVTWLPVDSAGRANPDAVKAAIRPHTALVSLMLANNEVGTLNDISEIGRVCRAAGVPLHTDAVQAPAYLAIDVNALNIDFLALSTHKFYGPKGVGILYVREGTAYLPTATGGGHERGRRAGTVNVAGAVGAAAALKHVSAQRDTQAMRLIAMRDQLIAGVLAEVPHSRLSGDLNQRLPNHASFLFKDVDGETLLMALDVDGIAVSTGSACSSGNPEPSPVLLAMGIAPEWALGGLRISLGYDTTELEIDHVIDVLPRIVQRLRKVGRFQ